MNDQKVKGDAGKPKLSLVPRQIIFDIARVREYGNAKYPEGGSDNWKNVEPERYRDAAFRHFLAYLDDPYGVDEESGLPHIAHLACNIAFLCELEKEKREDHKTDISKEPYMPCEPKLGEVYTDWKPTFCDLANLDSEFYRKDLRDGRVEFGNWNKDHTEIVPRVDFPH